MRTILVVFFPAGFLIASCNEGDTGTGETEPSVSVIPVINYAVTHTYPHDTTSFTEGLLVHEGALYESTGSPDDMDQTRSLIGILDKGTGSIHSKVELDREIYFGEGICFLKGKLYQLTYQHKKGFIYDAKSFKKTGEFDFASDEGWGLTTDSTYLIMSDGTNYLTYLDPVSFAIVKKISVTNEKGPVMKINELEYINHFIYANVYGSSTVIRIDPSSGKVTARLELNSLVNEANSRYKGSLEMNGIAYDPVLKKVYVTGKMWPVLYEIQFPH